MPRYHDLDTQGLHGRTIPLAGHFKRAEPGHGNADPETLGGSRLSVKQLINKGARTVDDALTEFRAVDAKLDEPDLVHSERTLLNRRRVVLLRRINGADPRYKVVGARVGGLSNEDQARVDRLKAVEDFGRFLDAEEGRQSA